MRKNRDKDMRIKESEYKIVMRVLYILYLSFA